MRDGGHGVSGQQADPARTESTLPYPYWRLDTPLAWIIGLYANVSNGGVLDDPTAYSDPTKAAVCVAGGAADLVQGAECGRGGEGDSLALHYPPYNGTIDFKERGNPTYGDNKSYPNAVPIGMVLQEAFEQAGHIPDAIFSAHAHLYQRITVAYADGSDETVQQVPCFIVGCGGHTQLELMATKCAGGTSKKFPKAPLICSSRDAAEGFVGSNECDGDDRVLRRWDRRRESALRVSHGDADARHEHDASDAGVPVLHDAVDKSGNPVGPGSVVLTDSRARWIWRRTC